MRDRVKQLHDHYFKPKPRFYFLLYDGDKEAPPPLESEAGQAQAQSIDIHVNLIV